MASARADLKPEENVLRTDPTLRLAAVEAARSRAAWVRASGSTPDCSMLEVNGGGKNYVRGDL